MRPLRRHTILFTFLMGCFLAHGSFAEQAPDHEAALSDNDGALASRVAANDIAAQKQLFETYQNLVWVTVQKVLGRDSQSIDDICQEVWMAMPRRIASYNPDKGKLSIFVLTMARNRAIDYIRAIKRRSTLNDAFQQARHMSPAAPAIPSNEVDRRETFEVLHKAIAGLSPMHAEAVRFYLAHATGAEMAEALGIPLGTAKARIRRAIKELSEDPTISRLGPTLFTCEEATAFVYDSAADEIDLDDPSL